MKISFTEISSPEKIGPTERMFPPVSVPVSVPFVPRRDDFGVARAFQRVEQKTNLSMSFTRWKAREGH
jgi:hypothetical protein